jgi:hypothetical protein
MEYPIPDYGDLFTIQEFIEMVKSGCFVNDDGTGYYATDLAYDRDAIARPSDIYKGIVLKGYGHTHVVWFNK